MKSGSKKNKKGKKGKNSLYCVFALLAFFASALRHLQNAYRGTAPVSELEPRHELTVSLAADVVWVDEAKPAVQFASRVSRDCGPRVAGRWGRQIEPVEEVEELCPNIEPQPLLDGEASAQAHVFR